MHEPRPVVAAVFALGFVAYCLVTGHIPLRFGDSIERSERPVAYWSFQAVLGGLGALLLVMRS